VAIVPIRNLPDPVLRQKAKKISGLDVSLRKLISNMIETLQDVNGVGLAAPQVGVSLRLVVIQMPDEGAKPIVLINPEIIKRSGEREVQERCLSIPGYSGTVKRAVSVTAKARDENWKEVRIKADELLAQALEHEIDHLSGILFVDRLEGPDKLIKDEPVEAEA
jgi:peptide deformylase